VACPLLDHTLTVSPSDFVSRGLALAATAARRSGRKVISTRTLFAALRRLHPEPLREFLELVPPEALPEALPKEVLVDPGALSRIESFSSCVQDSLEHLVSRSSQQRRLAAQDVFVDIAKYGKGESVRRLRTHGVDTSKVNEIVRQLGWRLTVRGVG
jgi:ATP-dependent Clp protease ATP-binding subunit ClpA